MISLVKRWIVVPVSFCILAIGFSSFVEDGEGDEGGIEEADYDKKKWTERLETITCNDISATITGTKLSNGKFKITTDLGEQAGGTYGVELNVPGHTSSFSISYVITFPSDENGQPVVQTRRDCLPDGDKKCKPENPCEIIARNQINSAIY